MTLDLGAVSLQVAAMGRSLQASGQSIEERLSAATELLTAYAADFGRLREKVEDSSTPWPVAGLVEPLDRRYPLPTPLPAYTVAATDGSQIEPDRHGTVLCHLINIGWAVIRYGVDPAAELASEPTLYHEDNDVYLVVEGRRTLVAGLLLDMKRNVEEMARLARLAQVAPRDLPMVALVDGILMMRATEGWRTQEFHRQLLPRFQESLNTFQSLGLPVAGYISRPRSHELVGTLRVAACPHSKADCASVCRGVPGQEPCAGLGGIGDRLLMERLPLRSGERSGRFRAQGGKGSPPTYFFYVNTGDEIGRVEVPDWVAGRPDLLDLVHWAVYDQCRRGNGYPRVLTEAHERAVLTTGDRQQFEHMVEAVLVRHRLSERTSAKERSKRLRGL